MTATLLVAQGHDRLHAGRLAGRPDAEEHTHGDTDPEGQGDRPAGDGRRHGREPPDQQGPADPEQDADDPAADRQGHRLQQELAEHVAGAGPDGLAQPDLPGPLGHADEHDVHHPDPADDQRDAGDRGQYQGQDAEDAPDHPEDVLLGQDLVLLLGMGPGHDVADDRLLLVDLPGSWGLDRDPVDPADPEQALGGGHGHEQLGVAGHPEGGPDPAHHADDPEADTADGDRLADRVAVGEQAVGRVGAEHGHPAAGVDVGGAEERPPGQAPVEHQRDGLGGSLDVDRGPPGPDPGDLARGDGGRDPPRVADGVADPADILQPQPGHARGRAERQVAGGDEQDVGAERLDPGGDLVPGPRADGHQQDHAGHPDDHPEHGQPGAELVGPQRLPGDPDGLPGPHLAASDSGTRRPSR